MIFLFEAVLSAGGVCRQFDVCSLERSSTNASQKGRGLLQEFLVGRRGRDPERRPAFAGSYGEAREGENEDEGKEPLKLLSSMGYDHVAEVPTRRVGTNETAAKIGLGPACYGIVSGA